MTDPGEFPIQTATVARLFMEQGKLEEAERILRRLLAQDPEEPRLLRGLAELERRKARLAREEEGADHVSLKLDARGAVTCAYRVTAEGEARARLVLEGPGRLVLRLVAFPVRSDHPPTDLPLETREGHLAVAPPEGTSLVGAAVGLAAEGERFVSITHARPIGVSSPPARRGGTR